MDTFREQVRRGFQACKDDITHMSTQQSQLNSGLVALQEENQLLKSEIQELRSLLMSMKDNINSQSTSEPALYSQTIAPENSGELYQSSNSTALSVTNNTPVKIKQKVEPMTSQVPIAPLDPQEALMQFKAKSNKKEVMKHKILQMIGDRGMFLNELKYMFVDYYKYVSKATFYNYLKEIELEKSIRQERVGSKTMVFLEVHAKEELLRNNNY